VTSTCGHWQAGKNEKASIHPAAAAAAAAIMASKQASKQATMSASKKLLAAGAVLLVALSAGSIA